jgi:hypothetical protein
VKELEIREKHNSRALREGKAPAEPVGGDLLIQNGSAGASPCRSGYSGIEDLDSVKPASVQCLERPQTASKAFVTSSVPEP